MKPRQPVLPGACRAIRAIAAGVSLVAALCLAGALAAFWVHVAHAQSGDEAKAPSNLTATIGDGGVILNWSSPVQDAVSVTGYEILRRRPREGEGTLLVLVADTGSTATTYVDATANEPGVRYVYRVKALRGNEKSSRSNYARVDLPEEGDETGPTPAPTPGGDTVRTSDAQVETCSGGVYDPTPTTVDVTTAPIVVTSTTADYFVLYVIHDVDGAEVELPVLAKRGEAGTTTLSENAEALPADRYRVEQYLIADPADVDGDCIDDITELDSLGNMNPVNPAIAIASRDGAVALQDQATFEALSIRERSIDPEISDSRLMKYFLLGLDTDHPRAYFMNTNIHSSHYKFLRDIVPEGQSSGINLPGEIIYFPDLLASDGSAGVYVFIMNYSPGIGLASVLHTLIAASMPLLENNLVLYIPNGFLPSFQDDLADYKTSRLRLVFDRDVYSETAFLSLNRAEGLGFLRVMAVDERPNPRDVVIYEALPNTLPRVVGIITTVPRTPLSHVNLRAVQNGIPNAYIRDVLDDPVIAPRIDRYVRYEVTETGGSLRAATPEEVDEHYESSRPPAQTPQRDLSVISVTPLSNVRFNAATPSAPAEESTAQPSPGGPRAEQTASNVEESDARDGGICDRTEAVRVGLVDLIDDLYPAVASCAEVTDAHLAAITALDLRHSGIDSLKVEDFAGLTGLETLKLARNRLRTLPAGVFAGLGRLKDLDLWYNELETLPAGVFSGLTSLQDLDLEENELHVLPAGVFDGLSLKFLGLEGNRLRTLPSGLFADVDVTLTLDLSDNELSALPGDVFSGLTNLNLLDLSENRLRELPPGVFSGLTGLTTLWVDRNPGAPFTFAMMPKRIPGTNKVVVTVAQGAPFPMTTTISVIGGTPPAGVFPVTVATGRTISDEIDMTSLGGATATMGASPSVPEGDAQGTFDGIETAVGGPVTFYDISAGAVAITSNPGLDETYAAGDAIEVTVTFAESMAVDTTDGIPQIGLTIGTMPKLAGYASGSGTAALVFRYTVAESDLDTDGLSTGIGSIPGHEVDGVKPLLLSAMVDDAGITLTYSEALRESPAPLASAFTVAGGAAARTVSDVAVTGSVVELALDSAVEDGETGLTVSYTPPAGTDTGAIQDLVGNEADGLSSEPVWSDAPERTDPVTNESPVITTTSRTTFSYEENGTSVIYTFRATDPEGGTIIWTPGGADGGGFIMEVGALTFASPPDYESPAGANGNEYQVTVEARDAQGNTASLPVTVTVTDVNEGPEVSGSQRLIFDENRTTDQVLATYTATDPEDPTAQITRWSVTGTDAGDFTINENGELQFARPPDYERPADAGGNNEYHVAVRAADQGGLSGWIDVTVTVEDVNEPPTVSGDDILSLPENTATTRVLDRYTATDPERGQISWSLSGADADDFQVDQSGNLTFSSAPDFELPNDSGGDNEYLVTVVATDDGSPAQGGGFDVTVEITDVDEPPAIAGGAIFDNYLENGASAVETYTASDPEGDTSITWSLAGPDRVDFTITGGALIFASGPDYESPTDLGGNNHYEITVEATDSNNRKGIRHVDVIVKNVDEPPVLTGPHTVDDFPENSNTTRQVGRYTASDPEGAAVTLSLMGTDRDDFLIAGNGVLTFDESPNYEGQDNHRVTVRAVAGSHAEDQAVSVNIQDLEEPGTVSLSAVQPQAGTGLSAALEDDDGPTGIRWQWYRTSGRSSAGTAIANATSRFYTPTPDDVGSYVRAVASYDDGHGTGKSATSVSANRVQARPADPEPPVFPADGNYARIIRENMRAGNNVGAPVAATDANNDRLTYSIGVSDYFEIVASTGQIRTRVELDHETGPTMTVTVTATDPGGLADSIAVTITVEDVDETPVVTGESTLEFQEGKSTGATLATYRSTDPDRRGIDLELSGNDSGDFTLSGGTLTFNAVPNFEEPADSNRDNRYQMTIEARERGDGASVGRLNVTVRVANVEEPGALEIPVTEPRVGQQLTPTVVDPDQGVTSIEWRWQRRTPGAGWNPIPGETSRSYTPTREDDGQDLRVIAIYRDRQGAGKSSTHEFTNPVVLRPFFSADTATRNLPENTPEGRNVGGRFTASHPDNIDLTYSLGGIDDRFFTIESATGQLQTSAIPLDYESLPGQEAEVRITATAPDNEMAAITVTITVTDECESSGEPPCAPGRPGVSSASETSLVVSWSAPRTPSGTSITGYEVRYRVLGSNDNWRVETVSDTDRSHPIENLANGTGYEVQVRAMDVGSGQYGEWSESGTGTPGATTTTPGGGGGGGGPVTPPPVALPEFSEEASATRTIPENTPRGQDIGDPVEATGTGLTYALSGDDAASFSIVSGSGQIRTGTALDFEVKSEYVVTVTATNAAEQSASIEVTINVTNVEEAGVVSVSSGEPTALAGLFATLSDLDGGITDRVWSWERSADNNVWTTIVGADTNTYTPTEADVGYYLRVSVGYTDAEGSGKRAQWHWTVAVVPEQPPVFSDGSAANRSVNENVAPGSDVGRPVRATGYRVAYTLAGEDVAAFEIVPATGQLKTREALDYELKSEYVVTVTATSETGESASIAIMIRVINLDEPGTVSLPSGAPMVSVELAASLSDPDGGVTDVSWTWEKSADRITWTVIDDAVASTYTPDEGDVGDYLRVTAGYADAQGTGKVAVAETDTAVAASSGEPRFVGPIGDFMVTTEGQEAGSVRLTWTPAEDAQVHFVVYIKRTEAAVRNYGAARIAPFAGSEGVIAGLEGGEEYLFIAIGMRWNWVNYGTVWGSWTSWVSATPTGEPPAATGSSTASEPSFVGSITDFAVTTAEQEAGSALLSWTPAENSQVHFVVYIKSEDVAARNYGAARIAPFAGSEGVVSGLESGVSYHFIVIGMRWNWVEYGTVWGTWSSWVSATPIASAPKSGQPSPAPEP